MAAATSDGVPRCAPDGTRRALLWWDAALRAGDLLAFASKSWDAAFRPAGLLAFCKQIAGQRSGGRRTPSRRLGPCPVGFTLAAAGVQAGRYAYQAGSGAAGPSSYHPVNCIPLHSSASPGAGPARGAALKSGAV